jgi:Outer membrane protein beta-barrel domain
MSIVSWQKTRQSFLLFGCAAFFLGSFASAQSTDSVSQSTDSTLQATASGWSSSQAMTEVGTETGQTQLAEGTAPADPSALPGAAPARAAQDQDQTYSGWHRSDIGHRLTWVAGGGFNAPIGNDTPYITWGGNFTAGGGVRFSRMVSVLGEYQFMGNKLPGNFIAAANISCSVANGTNCGITEGNAHFNSITASPVIDLTPNSSNGIYLVGGWGWYHKSTNFNAVVPEFNGFAVIGVSVTVASFSSSQWGGNGGLGIYHRLGGMYGKSKTQIFGEARYTFIHTPPITETNGLGTTGLIPVTIGVRF